MNLFLLNVHSESGDQYTTAFYADKMPHTDKEWLAVIKGEFPDEYDIAKAEPGGPGVAETYLHIESVEEISVASLARYEFDPKIPFG
jgi:hypothetical protein